MLCVSVYMIVGLYREQETFRKNMKIIVVVVSENTQRERKQYSIGIMNKRGSREGGGRGVSSGRFYYNHIYTITFYMENSIISHFASLFLFTF